MSIKLEVIYSKTIAKAATQKRSQNMFYNTDNRLIQVKSIAECFRPALSFHVSLRHLFCLFLSGRLRVYCTPRQIFLSTFSLQTFRPFFSWFGLNKASVHNFYQNMTHASLGPGIIKPLSCSTQLRMKI